MIRKRVLTLGMQRSGTTVIHSLVDGHPQVLSNPIEISTRLFIDPHHYFHATGLDDPNNDRGIRPRNRFFDAMAMKEGEDCDGTYIAALKVALGNPHLATRLVKFLQDDFPELCLLLVKRSDPLASYVSLVRAQKSGQWYNRGDQSQVKIKPFRLSLLALLRLTWSWSIINAALEELRNSHDHFLVNYEDDIESGDILNGKEIFGFLGIEEIAPNWLTMQKQVTDVSQLATNYDDALQVTQYAMAELSRATSFRNFYYDMLLRSPLRGLLLRDMSHPSTMSAIAQRLLP